MRKFYKFIAVGAMLTASVSAYADTSVWDGSVDTDWSTDADGSYLITSAAELAGLSQKVDNGETYLGSVFKLTVDVDLNNVKYWTPIGSISKQHSTNTTCNEKYFKGTFDGQGHSVINCNVYLEGPTSGLAWDDENKQPVTAGLFGAINSKATIKNLSVMNGSFIADCAKCYDAMAAAVCAYNDGGTIINCTSKDNYISCTSTYGLSGTPHAAGISGYTEGNATIDDCVAVDNTIAVNGDNEYSADVAVVRSGSTDLSSNCSSAADYDAWRAAKNEAAFLYCNLGVKLNDEVPEPYYWDENGITSDIYYVLMIDESKSQYPERKRSAATFSDKNEKMTTYTYRTEVGGDGNTYTLFAAGSTATMVAHLEGPKAAGDGSEESDGYYVKHIGDMPAQIGGVLSEDKNYSATTDRYERTQEFSVVMPAAMTTIWYEANTKSTTALDVVEIAKTTVTPADGKVIVSAPQGNAIVVADMMGRVIYSATATDEVIEIELAKGIYVVNGTKVAVR